MQITPIQIKMNKASISFTAAAENYLERVKSSFDGKILEGVHSLAIDLLDIWSQNGKVFICGNGGSAANAIHMANDFHYGIGACGPGNRIAGLNVEALSANSAILTCLANDTGYDNVYSNQLEVKASKNDLLIVLSGSGNSKNIINALKWANKIGLT